MAVKFICRLIRKLFITLTLILILTFGLLLIFVRGPFLALPIASILSKELGTTVKIDSVEYNLIYPQIISIHGLKIDNDFTAQTLYLEFDAFPFILKKKPFVIIKELDAISPQINNLEILEQIGSQLPAWVEPINKIWIKDLKTPEFSGVSMHSKNWNLHTSAVDNLFATASDITLQKAQTPWGHVNSGTIQLNCQTNRCKSENSIFINGGSIETKAEIIPENHAVFLDETKISGMVLSDTTLNIPKWKLYWGELTTSSSDIKLTIPDWLNSWEINGFNGIFNPNPDEFILNGDFATLSLTGITLSSGEISISNDGNFTVKGFAQENTGNVVIEGIFDEEHQLLKLNNIMLNHISANITDEWLKSLPQSIIQGFEIKNLECTNCEIVSGLPQLEFFARHSDIRLTDLKWRGEHRSPFFMPSTTMEVGKLSIYKGDLGLFGQRLWNPKLNASVSDTKSAFDLQFNENSHITVTAKPFLGILSPNENLKSANSIYQIDLNAENINPSAFILPQFPKLYGNVQGQFKGFINNSASSPLLVSGILTLKAENLDVDGLNLSNRLKQLLTHSSIETPKEFFYPTTNEVDELHNLQITANLTGNKLMEFTLESSSLEGKYRIDSKKTPFGNSTTANIQLHDFISEQDSLYQVHLKPVDNRINIEVQSTPEQNPTKASQNSAPNSKE